MITSYPHSEFRRRDITSAKKSKTYSLVPNVKINVVITYATCASMCN